MDAHDLEARLSEYDARLSFFDAKLKPRGTRLILTPKDMEEEMKRPHPLDEAGIRPEAENLLAAVIELYASTPEAREPIREMFRRYTSVARALWPSQRPTSEDGFRIQLLRISMMDYRRDPRDIPLVVGPICCEAENAGVKIQPILESVAAISSDVEPYGPKWSSMRETLLLARVHYREWGSEPEAWARNAERWRIPD
jgi:hypothetical protein